MVPRPGSVVGVTYTDVMATTELLDLARPAAAAAGGGRPQRPPGRRAGRARGRRRAGPAALTAAVRATPLERWTAADPNPALLVHRAVLDARAAVEDEARDALRIALERLSHALAALGGGRGGRLIEPLGPDRCRFSSGETRIVQAPGNPRDLNYVAMAWASRQ